MWLELGNVLNLTAIDWQGCNEPIVAARHFPVDHHSHQEDICGDGSYRRRKADRGWLVRRHTD